MKARVPTRFPPFHRCPLTLLFFINNNILIEFGEQQPTEYSTAKVIIIVC